MSLFSRACFASTVFAAVLASTALAQPPERGRGGDRDGGAERGRGGDRDGGAERGRDRDGGERRDAGQRRGPPDGFEGRRGGPPPEVMMRMMPVLAALDADHDGKISKAEIDNASVALRSLDKNKDGQLTAEEMRPDFAAMGGRGGPPGGGRPDGEGRPGGGRPDAAGRPGGGRPDGEGRPAGQGRPGGSDFFARMFQERDANKDGKLSGDEISEQMAGRMEQIDTDKDGSVSRAEMEKMMSRMRERGGRDRAGQGGSDSGGRPGGDRPRRPEAE